MKKYSEQHIWTAYYDHFEYFSPDIIRRGCEPRLMVQPGGAKKAVVLVHGLTDSPYAMLAIANYFYQILGYDVYLPLLQCHGLRDPKAMAGVSCQEWKKNVQFAVDAAVNSGARVSIGGLSTGGALGFNLAARDARIKGELYLFSAAFSLYGGSGNLVGKINEYLLTKPLLHLFTSPSPLVGENPYRYDRVPFNSARELVFLMWENNKLIQDYKKKGGFQNRIFSAWSWADKVVSVDAIMDFAQIADSVQVTSFGIASDLNVHHACVVLAEPIFAVGSSPGDPPLELENPRFNQMMEALQKFEALK